MRIELNFNQSAVIPYRFTKRGIEVLLITSVKKGNWIVPKGYIEFNLTPFESAKKEAYEEAGVIGSNETHEAGVFKQVKSIGTCLIKVFTMEVLEELDDYPEKKLRQRKWFQLEEAARQISIPQIKKIIENLESFITI